MTSSTVYPHIQTLLTQLAETTGRVVELGCGGRQYAACFTGSYVGLDMETGGYPGGKADVIADAQYLPLKDGVADLAFIVAALLVIPDTSKVLAEAHRILRPGGTFVVFDYSWWVARRLQRAGSNTRHRFTSLGLRRQLATSGFAPSVHWRCASHGGPPIVRPLRRLAVGQVGLYMAGNWNIVSGVKTTRTDHQGRD